MPWNAAALSVADVIRRVSRLSAVSRSARSPAWRSVGPWRSGAGRVRFAGLERCRLLNVEAQQGVRPSQRALDGIRRLGAGKDESEILPALWQRDHLLARMHRDGHVLDAVDRGRLVGATNRREPARARDRNHHDARGAPLALERFEGPAERMAEDQLLQAQPRPEGQGARAQA